MGHSEEKVERRQVDDQIDVLVAGKPFTLTSFRTWRSPVAGELAHDGGPRRATSKLGSMADFNSDSNAGGCWYNPTSVAEVFDRQFARRSQNRDPNTGPVTDPRS